MDTRDLYQSVIMDHQRSPRNFREPEEFDRKAQGDNPLCGDKVTIYITLDGDVVKDVAFQGSGCAISTAAASLMSEFIMGKSVEEVESLFERFHAMVAGDPSAEPDSTGLGKLVAFAGVREFPMRVKCATLAWHTMYAALVERKEKVTTE